MEEREFAKYALLIVAVVAVVGLLTSGGGLTGFATKVGLKAPTISCEKAKQMVATYCKDNAATKRCKDAKTLVANVCKVKQAPRPAPRPAQRQAPPTQQQAPPQPASKPEPGPSTPADEVQAAPACPSTTSRCDGNMQINVTVDCSGHEVESRIACPNYPNNVYTCVGINNQHTLCAPCGSRVCETQWGITWFDASYQGDACRREITRANC